MKKVIAMLALVALTGNIASAELLKNFKANGSVEVNAYNTTNADFNKKTDDQVNKTDTRVQINATFDLNDDVNAVVSAVKTNRQYGQGSENISDGTGASGGIFDNVYFEQAYLNLKGVLGLDHKLGRQYYGEAGDMIVYYGPLGWPYTHPMNRNAIDGWTGYYSNWGVDFTGLIANQAQTINVPEKDITVNGLTAAGKVYDVALRGYVYQKNDKSAASAKTNYLDVVGVKAKYAIPQVKNLNVAGEYAMNMGLDANKKNLAAPNNVEYEHQGFAYKFNADYSMDLMGKLGINGEYYYATGDKKADKKDKAFKAINSDYRPGIIVGGAYNGTINNPGTGMKVMDLGANWTPSKLEKLNVAVSYYDFSYAEKNAAAGAKTNMGTESDLVLTWTHSDNVNVKGYYAMFAPEKKNLTAGRKDDAQSVMGAAFMVKF